MPNPIKAVKAVKKITTRKQKAINKADRIGPGIGKPTTDSKNNIVETMTSKKVTGKKKRMSDTANLIEKRAKGVNIRGMSDLKYPSSKWWRDLELKKYPKSKVPVKRRGK